MKSGDLIRPRAYATIGHEVHVAAREAKHDQLAVHRARMQANVDASDARHMLDVALVVVALAIVGAAIWMMLR